MKNFTLLRSCIVIVSLLLGTVAWSQSNSGNKTYWNTINVPEYGKLNSVLTQEQKDTITSLKLTGYLNSSTSNNVNSDFYILRATMPNLKDLDISETTIQNNNLPNSALYSHKNIREIRLPEKLTRLGSSAFSECSSLASINFPDSLITIEDHTFYNCANLSGKLVLSESLTKLGYNAFNNCVSLNEIVLSKELQTIEENVFYNCASLKNVTLPEKLQTINNYAFRYCRSLETIEFPENLKTINYYAFDGCSSLVICRSKAIVPPVVHTNSNTLAYIRIVYVPEESEYSYNNATGWSSRTIIRGEDKVVNVELTDAGTLGEKVLDHVALLQDVNRLIVSGPLNDSDLNDIKNMTTLISIDMSGAVIDALPNAFFDGRSLIKVVLPETLKTMGTHLLRSTLIEEIKIPEGITVMPTEAFHGCYRLSEVELSSGLKSIATHGFRGTGVINIKLPETIESIDSYAFNSCTSLTNINLPASLKSLGSEAFSECHSLQKIEIPAVGRIRNNTFYNCVSLSEVKFADEGISDIGSYTFYNCNSLKSLKLPAQLKSISHNSFHSCTGLVELQIPSATTSIGENAFYNCGSLKSINCLSSIPITLTYDPFRGVDKFSCELVVPFWSVNQYKLADYWCDFANFIPYEGDMKDISINSPLILSNDVRPKGVPNIIINPTGSLTLRGNTSFSMDSLTMVYEYRSGREYHDEEWKYYNNGLSSLINDSPSTISKETFIEIHAYANTWYYFSFPFEVAVRDITIDEGTQFVIRRYDSEARASVGTGSSWKNMTVDSVLHVGVGYIFQCNKGISRLVIKPTSSAINQIYKVGDQAVPLREYASDNIANRSWNFVGNPFPSYFNIQAMNYTAPITVWNGSGYTAISPVDDNYVLNPLQAFFVQRPNDLDAIVFLPEGRQTTSTVNAVREVNLNNNTNRTLINLSIGIEDFTDKSRIVLNPEAQLGYEIERDAAKFMSSDKNVPQLYSVDGNIHYAINERPLGSGIIPLGYYAGANNNYTISVDVTSENITAYLKDKLLNTVTELNNTDYTFHSDTGTYNNRFELQLTYNGATGMQTNELFDTTVTVKNGYLIVKTEVGTAISVYSLAGIKLQELKASDVVSEISLSKGTYIVKVGANSYKTVIF